MDDEVKTKTIYDDELKMQNYFFKLLKGTEKKPSANLLVFPFLRWVHSSGNGIHKPRGIERGLAKSNGQTRGVWDVLCPFCRTYIEFKVGDEQLTKEQREFREDNNNFAYKIFNDPIKAYDWVIDRAKELRQLIDQQRLFMFQQYVKDAGLHQAAPKSV